MGCVSGTKRKRVTIIAAATAGGVNGRNACNAPTAMWGCGGCVCRACLAHARRRNTRAHRITMISIFVGALVITGLFTLLPQRLIGQAVWGLLG